MPSHRLTHDKYPNWGKWLLRWDESRFTLIDPDNKTVAKGKPSQIHRLVRLIELYQQNKICIKISSIWLYFKADEQAAADLIELVEAGIRSDRKHRHSVKRDGLRLIMFGLALLLPCASALGLFCWWLANEGEVRADHWLHGFEWLITLTSLFLFFVAIRGLGVCWYGLKQIRLIQCTERELKAKR